MPQGYLIGVDVGGTQVKFGCFSASSGRPLHTEILPTHDGRTVRGKPAWAVAIRKWIHHTEITRGPAAAVGLAAPGLAGRGNRSIAFMPGRLAGLEGLDWTDFVGRPVTVLNDAHAALMGEVWRGAAKGLENAVLLTLGTGVGGAILCDGRLLQGHVGRAGHLGHLCLDVDGPPTICGIPGGLDWQIGNASVPERSGGRFANTRKLVAAAQTGDPEARRVWDRSVHCLACAIASLINVLDPQAILIGGGIATVGDRLFRPLRRKLSHLEWRPGGRRVKLLPAKLGEWAGACGAAAFAQSQFQPPE